MVATEAAALPPRLLVLDKTGNRLAVVDPATYKVLATVPTGEAPHEIAVSADGKTAYISNYGRATPGSSLSVVDLVTTKEIKRVALSGLCRPHGVVVAGGKVWFTSEESRAIASYDPASGAVDWVQGTGQTDSHMLVVTRDGKKTYVANIGSDTVTVFDLAAQTDKSKAAGVAHIAVGKEPEAIALAPSGTEVWVGQNEDGHISIIDTATDKVKATFKIADMPIRIAFTPDGKHALVTDARAHELIVVNAATRKEVKRIKIGQTPVGVLVAPDGKRAFVSTFDDGKVVVINLTTFKVITRIALGNPDGLAWRIGTP